MSGPPVGVFDSGVGGLAVLAEIRRACPREPLVYVADSAFAPYGERAPAYIAARSEAIADFLVSAGARALVVACNTATAAVAGALRARLALPVVAIEPAVKPAAAGSARGTIGVLATAHTLASERYARLVSEHAGGVDVLAEPCPDLVRFVERGETDGAAVAAAVARHLAPLLAAGVDTVVLGCTHFHFLRALVERAAGPGVRVLDPGAAVARELARRLGASAAPADAPDPGPPRVYTSGDPGALAPLAGRLWGAPLAVEPLPAAYCRAPGA